MNTNIPLSARGVQIENPLDQYGKVLSLQQMIQQKQLGDQQLGELVRKQKYEVEKRDAFKTAHDEVTQYMQNTLSKERFQLGAPPDGNQADMNAPAVPTIAPQVIANDPRYHYLMAQKLQSGGYLEDAKLAMEYGQKLEKDNAPKSEAGKIAADFDVKGMQREMLGKMAIWKQVKGDPPQGFAWHPETGEPTPMKEVQDFILNRAEKGAAKTTNNINVSTEKKYSEKFAEKLADEDIKLRDAAQKAPDIANRARRVLQILREGDAYTGMGADVKLALAKVGTGIAGFKLGERTIANTEELGAFLANNTLDAIGDSKLGGGTGFSNADREFLEKAKGGKLTLDAPTLERLAKLNIKAAENVANKWNKRATGIPQSAIEGTGLDVAPVEVPKDEPASFDYTPDDVEAILNKYK